MGIRDVLEIPRDKEIDLMNGCKRDMNGVRRCNSWDQARCHEQSCQVGTVSRYGEHSNPVE